MAEMFGVACGLDKTKQRLTVVIDKGMNSEGNFAWIDEYGKKYNLSLFAYCLMDNHVHFIAIPRKEESLAKVFSITQMRYSQYFNKKKNISGHLWQGRFYSCVLDEPHLLVALRYVEKNPVRAGIVEKAWQWKWSSAAVHIGRPNGAIREKSR